MKLQVPTFEKRPTSAVMLPDGYELNGHIYTMDDLSELAEHKQITDKIERIACIVLSAAHAWIAALGAASLNAEEGWEAILAMVIYCVAAAIMFGLMARRKERL